MLRHLSPPEHHLAGTTSAVIMGTVGGGGVVGGGGKKRKDLIAGFSFFGSISVTAWLFLGLTRHEWCLVRLHFAVSRQQPHAGELGRQEGVEDEHDRLGTRVEVKHLQRVDRGWTGASSTTT